MSDQVPPMTAKARLRLLARVAKYRAKILAYKTQANLTHRTAVLAEQPSATLFISSYNTRYALELTLSSLKRNTSYQNYKILIADNASTDGSKEFLATLKDDRIRVINDTPRPHGEWLDRMLREMDTKYWFAVDSDMLFLAPDWLSDLVRVFESDPNVYLLSGEPKPGGEGLVEPFDNQVVDAGECPSTWLFGVRTALRDFVDTSFVYCHDGTNEATGRLMTYDTGGKFLRDMRRKNLGFAIMPPWFAKKWYHFGSLSWLSTISSDPSLLLFKQYQQADIQRRVQAMTTR